MHPTLSLDTAGRALLGALALLLLAGGPAAAGDPQAGRQKARQC